ncbi:MAG: spore coat protein U domain-containing protein [Vannielia sp.]|uniref:Csu type fimbrial protein n=1 Tax=Vannielia sp. TaxID=2813045 RepID=UPI003B8DEEC3
MSKFVKLACATTVGLGMSVVAASAETATTNLNVTATVLDSCTVAAPLPLTFGSFNTNTTTSESTAGNITVVCTSPKTGATVSLGGGGAAAEGSRNLKSGANAMPYSIFRDSAHETEVAIDGDIWEGDLDALTLQNISVFGQIPAGSYAFGVYTDTVLVTLTY